MIVGVPADADDGFSDHLLRGQLGPAEVDAGRHFNWKLADHLIVKVGWKKGNLENNLRTTLRVKDRPTRDG